jgi:hypothetical protein
MKRLDLLNFITGGEKSNFIVLVCTFIRTAKPEGNAPAVHKKTAQAGFLHFIERTAPQAAQSPEVLRLITALKTAEIHKKSTIPAGRRRGSKSVWALRRIHRK